MWLVDRVVSLTMWLVAVVLPPLTEQPRLCQTPSGFHPCDCVHTVPSGTRAEEHLDPHTRARTLRLHHPNGTIRTLPQCPHKRPPPSARPVSAAPNVTDPCKLGWAHAAPLEAFYQHSKDIAEFSATYTVPDAPTTTQHNILYYWIGLQDLNSTENPVIQPVLSYVPGATANNWYFASWNCCPAGHKLEAAKVAVSGPGEVLRGSMTRDAASGIYTITSANAAGQASVLLSDDTNSGLVRTWNWIDVVLETYAVDDCAQYANGGRASFLDMRLTDVQGAQVTPTFTHNPYIDGKYLPAAEATKFAACCRGTFSIAWPNATMEQN